MYGPLIPVGDDAALAMAVASVLDSPPKREQLRARAGRFGVDRATERYLEVLIGVTGASPSDELVTEGAAEG